MLKNITKINDEMVLKTMLDTLRHFISFLRAHQKENEHPLYQSNLSSLLPLINLKDDNDDFFASFLAIKMKTR